MDAPNTHYFVATFDDGTQVVQDADDQSQFDSARNCYFDVLELQKTKRLISFVLNGPEHDYGVDLQDGHFEINGVAWFPYRPDLEQLSDFTLVYRRTVQQHRHITPDGGTSDTANIAGYSIGWKSDTDEKVMFIM